jgi:hypothetical protein
LSNDRASRLLTFRRFATRHHLAPKVIAPKVIVTEDSFTSTRRRV